MLLLGQPEILTRFESYNMQSLSHTILLVGKDGCGKRTLCRGIADKFQLDIIDLTNSISLEVIDDIYESYEKALYIIDTSEITVKEQNMLLKVLEDTPNCAYFVLLTLDAHNLLETIQNRCEKYFFANYSKETLSQFLPLGVDSDILNYAETPGQVIQYASFTNFNDMCAFALRVVDKIQTATICNALSITQRIAFNNEKDLYDPYLFAKVLQKYALQNYKQSGNIESSIIYKCINQLANDVANSHIYKFDLKQLYDVCIIDIKLKLENHAK